MQCAFWHECRDEAEALVHSPADREDLDVCPLHETRLLRSGGVLIFRVNLDGR